MGFVECGRTSLGSAGSAGSGCSCFVVSEIRGTSVLLSQQEESHSYYGFNSVSFGSVSHHFLQSPTRVCLKLPFQVPISACYAECAVLIPSCSSCKCSLSMESAVFGTWPLGTAVNVGSCMGTEFVVTWDVI